MNTTNGKGKILAQILIAFGQGAGPVRVSREACGALIQHYEPLIDDAVEKDWQDQAVQALERVRTTGRLAVQTMTREARTAINKDDVEVAYTQVEKVSATSICSRG